MDDLRAAGFTGFVPVSQLRQSLEAVPNDCGVYVVLRRAETQPSFRSTSPAGHFKGKNPTLAASGLRKRWLDSTPILYIGKAGGPTGKATLRSRIGQYIQHGEGKPIGHWGGRSIWQLEDSDDLVVCWKTTPNEDPRVVEKGMISEFVEHFSARPFANLVG